MKLENYEVHLPNYSIGDKIYDKIGTVCESYGKKVLVIGGKKALDAAYGKIRRYVDQTDLEIIGKELYGENCTYATVEKLRALFSGVEAAVKSMSVGFVVNALMMLMVVIGLMTVYTDPGAAGQSIPTLFMVQNGVGAAFMTPLISILIILGAVSTAVNMVAAMVKRICKENGTEQTAGGLRKEAEKKRYRISGKEAAAALVCCLVDFGIAQFGLLTLIQKAYSAIAYLAIPVILVPYVIRMLATRFDTKSDVR